MTTNNGTQSKYTKPLMMTGSGIFALALLTGCTTADPGTSETADDAATTATSAPAESSPAAGTGDSADDQGATGSPTGDSTSGSTTAVAGDDPVFAAIDALLAEREDAMIIQVDREDGDSYHEIEAVIGDRIVDFDVTGDGTVREDDDDEDDDDDIRKANEAQVTAEDAARAALEGRDGQTIDDMELDEDDGTLVWEVDVDNEDGDDGDDLKVDAMTGEVRSDD